MVAVEEKPRFPVRVMCHNCKNGFHTTFPFGTELNRDKDGTDVREPRRHPYKLCCPACGSKNVN